jgi:hypothetical protein
MMELQSDARDIILVTSDMSQAIHIHSKLPWQPVTEYELSTGVQSATMYHLRATHCYYHHQGLQLTSFVLASPISSLAHYSWRGVVGRSSMKGKFA